MRRLLQIAREDVLDAARDRELYVIGVVFLLVGLGIGYFLGNASPEPPDNAVALFTLGALTFFGSISAIALSYNRVVGKRASGELRVLLSLPFSRFETVYGAFLGRWAMLTSLSVGTIVIAAALAALLGAPVAVGPLLAAVVTVAALLAVFTSLSIGLSAGSVNTTRAAAGAFGLFILFLFRLWEVAPAGVRYVLNGFERPEGPSPAWAEAWGQIAPIAGARNAIADSFPELAGVLTSWAPSTGDSTPVYAEPWFGAVVVAVWIVAPVTLGYLRLRKADL